MPTSTTPPSPDARILKSSAKYLILSCEEEGVRCVYKIAHRDPDKLRQEVARIANLTAAIPSLRDRLPRTVRSGAIASGAHAGKAYYVQSHVPGSTFSQWVQSRFTERAELQVAFGVILRALLDIVADHRCDTAYDHRSGQCLREFIREEYDRLRSLDLIAPILADDALTIDGGRYASLAWVLDQLDAQEAYALLDRGPSSIATLGHWNFHGDNLILSTLTDAASFAVIDPDVSIETCDPLFGIARFLYTFPHDTADYGQYLIHSDTFDPRWRGPPVFRVTHLWSESVYRNYAELFGVILAAGAANLGRFDARLHDPRTALRLQLCVLACLLRGVRANYEESAEFVEGRATTFRHKGLFLFLEAVRFANRLVASVSSAVTADAPQAASVTA